MIWPFNYHQGYQPTAGIDDDDNRNSHDHNLHDDSHIHNLNENYNLRHALYAWQRNFVLLAAFYLVTLLIIAFYSWHPSNTTAQSFFPPIHRRAVIFEPNQTFIDEYPGTIRNPTIWDALVPDGGGFVIVPNPRAFGLSGGFPIENNADEEQTQTQEHRIDHRDGDRDVIESYGISLYHQLHCLALIKSAFGPRDRGQRDHLGHCIEYLRQTILCAGDTTMERALIVDGQPRQGVDGWGTPRTCRDWEAIWDFATAHRSGNKMGIL